MNSSYFFTFLICLLTTKLAFGMYYSTLPKGARTLVFRQVITGTVTGNYNSAGGDDDFVFNFDLNAPTLYDIDPAVKQYFDALKGASQEAFDKFNLASFKGMAAADVNVKVFAFGIGLTERITVYAYLPYYKATTNVRYVRTRGNNQAEVLDIIRNSGSSGDETSLAESFTEYVAKWDISEQTVQWAVSDYFGYKPLGTWEAQGFGDIEAAAMIRLTDWKNCGLLINPGVSIPVGRKDDPDILQDFGFGDGQWDLFTEFGGGYFFHKLLTVDSWIKYNHQFSYHKEIRLPDTLGMPLTRRKGNAKISPGDQFEFHLKTGHSFTSWLSVSPEYIYLIEDSWEYETPYADATAILESNSWRSTHSYRLSLDISTVDLYLAKKFMIPFRIHIGYQNVFAGKNSTNYERIGMQFMMFF